MNFILNLDLKIFQAINSLAGKWQILDWLAIFCAQYLIFIIAIVVLVWWINLARTRSSEDWPYQGKRKWLVFGNLGLSPIISFLVNQLLGMIRFRQRPFLNLDVNQLIGMPLGEKSFPSDHTVIAFSIAFAVFFYNKKLGSVLLFLSLLVGLSRIYVGVHYPLDITAGIIVAAIVAVILKFVFFNKKEIKD